MRVSDIISLLPEAGPLLGEYGLHCFHCSANDSESLADGCASHGFAETEIASLVDDLNRLLTERPQRPATLTLTKAAAEGLRGVMEGEGRAGQILIVGLDVESRFCLEFAARTPAQGKIFSHREVPGVILAALPDTLDRIGGATIDLRDGRFKLDLPEMAAAPACSCSGGRCQCRR